MVKRKKDPLLEALKDGRDYTWTVPDGGNLASMRKAIKHGQTITMSPISDTVEIQVGDFVLVKWHQSDIFHIVGEIQKDKFLIVNSLGKENGWVEREAILGKVTKIIEPEPRPDVPVLLENLKVTYNNFIEQVKPTPDDAQRLLFIVDDLQWYAERISEEKWDIMPRDNLWSFHQNLWRLSKQARYALTEDDKQLNKMIDAGKKCVGHASEIISLFDSRDLRNN